ncbi:MAG TPA: trypsin-like serine protease [Streptosporangiaceae bacterium]
MRTRRRSGRHAVNRAAAWFTRPTGRLAVVGTLTVGVVVTVTPANGAATDIASHVASDVHNLVISQAETQNGVSFTGTPAVGALFTSAKGKLNNHFCTASVVNSPGGDLAVTAAHCMSNVSGSSTVMFVPGYHNGDAPYGSWQVTKVYFDQAWTSSQSQGDDVAFIKLARSGSDVPIEDVTGAEKLATGTSVKQKVQVIGYPDGKSEPVSCVNWTSQPQAGQLQFDCGGYTDGTSGGPFLADVSSSTGQGTVIGVIGGLDQGGYTPQVSYSIEFESNVARLYQEAKAGG